MNNFKRILTAALALSAFMNFTACGASEPISEAPNNDPSPKSISASTSDIPDYAAMTLALNAFSTQLFKQCDDFSPETNTLVSPISVYMALSMVMNGANGDTLTEMEHLLAGSRNSADNINSYALNYLNSANNNILSIANSMFIMKRDDITINDKFKNKLTQTYGAELFSEVYSEKTVDHINSWVNDKTHKMIPKILDPDSINESTVSVLLNAVAFEGEWTEEYTKDNVTTEDFMNLNGTSTTADYLNSTESIYIENDDAAGFIKPYKTDKNGDYSFIAILPNEDIDIANYISSLTADTIDSLVNDQTYTDVLVKIPKFTFDSTYSLKNMLSDMGMPSAFYDADFSGITTSTDIVIGDVIHKTHIELDEKGTKAAAATAVTMFDNAAAFSPEEPKEVFLTRPFVFMIYDNTYSCPIFIGKLCTMDQ